MAVITFDPRDVVLTYGGAVISGFAPDTFIEVEFFDRRYALSVGADGRGVRSKRNNRGATVRISLQPGADSNLVFQAAMAADEAGNAGVAPLGIQSFGTGQSYNSAGAWVAAEPGGSFQSEAQPQVWELDTDELLAIIGKAP